MHQWKLWDIAEYPCCGHPSETMRHIPLCLDPHITEVWEEQLAALEAWLLDADTHPALTDCIVDTLGTRDPTSCFHDYASSEVGQAAKEQDQALQAALIVGNLRRLVAG